MHISNIFQLIGENPILGVFIECVNSAQTGTVKVCLESSLNFSPHSPNFLSDFGQK